MSKLLEAAEILKALGLPAKQYNKRSCLTLLALAGLHERSAWTNVQRPLLRIWDIMAWMRDHFGQDYAANSRETIRRQTIHQFEQARLVDRNPDNPQRATNSGETRYQLTKAAAAVLRSFDKPAFLRKCKQFNARYGKLSESYARTRKLHRVPITFPDGKQIEFSPGPHNRLQQLVVQEFAPRFAQRSEVLYLGDTANKRLIVQAAKLAQLGVLHSAHDKLPDIVLYDTTRRWLFLIEAVTTHGPVSPKRHAELETLFADCSAGRVYVTAFLDFRTFRKYAAEIVWESEVWIAEFPDHMIHFDGDKFLGPYGALRPN